MHSTADIEHSNSRARLLRAGQSLVKQLDELAGPAARHIHTLNRQQQQQQHHQQQQQQQQQHYHQTHTHAQAHAQHLQGFKGRHAEGSSDVAFGRSAATKGPDIRKQPEAAPGAAELAEAVPPSAVGTWQTAPPVAPSPVASVSAAAAAAAARSVAGSLREVVEGLAAEGQAMRRAVRSGRLGRAAEVAADELEEVVAQVRGA